MSELLNSGGRVGKILPFNVFRRHILLEKIGHETDTEMWENYYVFTSSRKQKQELSEKWKNAGLFDYISTDSN